jgi:hypothetical protein
MPKSLNLALIGINIVPKKDLFFYHFTRPDYGNNARVRMQNQLELWGSPFFPAGKNASAPPEDNFNGY